jgi:hypothetical protein
LGAFAKTCRTNPTTSNCKFTGVISDLGESGVRAEDYFSISVDTGPFKGHTNAGPSKEATSRLADLPYGEIRH